MAIPHSITTRSSFQITSSKDFLHHSEPKSLDISIPHIYSRPFFQNDVWQLKNTAAARNYEVALDRRSYIVHFNNQQRIAKVIIGWQEKFYMEHPVATPAGFRPSTNNGYN